VVEHETRFRKLHDKVADVTAELFRRLSRLYRAVGDYIKIFEVSGEATKVEKLQVVSQRALDFSEFFGDNLLFLPPELFGEVTDLAGELTTIANKYTWGAQWEKKGMIPKEEDADYWTQSEKAYREKAMPAFEKIRNSFQHLLGFKLANGRPATNPAPQ
jgi:hypothetical protein